mgnify:CR=1 FL=1
MQQTAGYALMLVGCGCLIGPLYPVAALIVLHIPFVKDQFLPAHSAGAPGPGAT